MVIKSKIAVLSTALLFTFLYASPQADAQRGRSVSNAGRAVRAAGNIGKVPAVRAMQGGNHNRGASPFPILDAINRASRNGGGGGGRNNNNNTPFPLLNALSQIDNGHHNGGNGHNGGKNHGSNPWNFLYGLSQAAGYGGYGQGYPGGGYGYGGGYGGYPYYDSYNRHKSDEEYADAIRDSAIASAVGNVVSAIVTSPNVRTGVPVYAQPAHVYTQPAPVYVQPSPLGRYETRREVVGGGYYERQQIYVPEVRDPRSGSIVEGHYENVKKWVPEVIQETQVWVAP